MKKIIFIDVDEVCASLHSIWLQLYNQEYDDTLTNEDIHDWAIDKYVKPECGTKIFKYLKERSLYDSIQAKEDALDGVNSLREMGHKIFFATTSPIETIGRKFFWLKEHGFTNNPREYIEISNKGLLLGDYMLDDSYANIKSFQGCGCLLTAPWNTKYSWDTRVENWQDFIYLIEKNK